MAVDNKNDKKTTVDVVSKPMDDVVSGRYLISNMVVSVGRSWVKRQGIISGFLNGNVTIGQYAIEIFHSYDAITTGVTPLINRDEKMGITASGFFVHY